MTLKQAKKIPEYFGLFWTKICYKEVKKNGQSCHTALFVRGSENVSETETEWERENFAFKYFTQFLRRRKIGQGNDDADVSTDI